MLRTELKTSKMQESVERGSEVEREREDRVKGSIERREEENMVFEEQVVATSGKRGLCKSLEVEMGTKRKRSRASKRVVKYVCTRKKKEE